MARYIYQNKVLGIPDFQYYYIVDSFGKSQWRPLYRFSTVLRYLEIPHNYFTIFKTLNDL